MFLKVTFHIITLPNPFLSGRIHNDCHNRVPTDYTKAGPNCEDQLDVVLMGAWSPHHWQPPVADALNCSEVLGRC